MGHLENKHFNKPLQKLKLCSAKEYLKRMSILLAIISAFFVIKRCLKQSNNLLGCIPLFVVSLNNGNSVPRRMKRYIAIHIYLCDEEVIFHVLLEISISFPPYCPIDRIKSVEDI